MLRLCKTSGSNQGLVRPQQLKPNQYGNGPKLLRQGFGVGRAPAIQNRPSPGGGVLCGI